MRIPTRTGNAISKIAIGLLGIAVSRSEQITARELFYNPANDSTPQGRGSARSTPYSAKHPGLETENGSKGWALRFVVLKRMKTADFEGVDMTRTVFQPGDAIRVQIQANRAIFVNVLQMGSSGAWSLLFANNDRIPTLQPIIIPPAPARFSFDSTMGIEHPFIVASVTELDVSALLPTLNGNRDSSPKSALNMTEQQNVVLRALHDSLSGLKTRDLLFQQAEQKLQSHEDTGVFYAGYIGHAGEVPQVVHFTLNHSDTVDR
jgi:hypothetical protein